MLPPLDCEIFVICLVGRGIPPPFFKRCRHPSLWRITPTVPLRYRILYMWTYHKFRSQDIEGRSHSEVDSHQELVTKDESHSYRIEEVHHPH